MVNKYTYRVEWSSEDKTFIARCLELPSLAAHGNSQADALKEIISVVNVCVEDMEESKEPLPEPLGEKKYSGKFIVRLSPEQHKQIIIQAKEQNQSLNQYVVRKLSSHNETFIVSANKRVKQIQTKRKLSSKNADEIMIKELTEKRVSASKKNNDSLRTKRTRG